MFVKSKSLPPTPQPQPQPQPTPNYQCQDCQKRFVKRATAPRHLNRSNGHCRHFYLGKSVNECAKC